MAKVLIIGAGGVGAVVAHKCAVVPEVFSEILLASRTKSKCDKIAAAVGENRIQTNQVNADSVPEMIALINSFRPDLVINVALPYQDLPIMDACLATKTNYLDTANYEPIDEAKFEYKWQWAYHEKFKEAGIMALLGCGFDPGVTGIYTAFAAKHFFDEIHYLDIVDCNAGDHGKAFATNFNPEINIREITQPGKYWENGKWHEVPAMSIHKPIHYPKIGEKESYLLFHEELESLTKNFPTLKRARFWMTFGPKYINVLNVLQEVGMTSIKPVMYEGKEIVPLQFLKVVLPEPSSLAEGYTGQTSIGCQIRGIKDGKERTYYIWNNCDHAEVNKEIGAQAISYTTGVPAMLGAKMILTGKWKGKGVFNVEEFDPDPFMEEIGKYGLPWNQEIDRPLPVEATDLG
ncbi:MAG: saccharopine dehydrogenase family protein [Bacteroidales bacterium]|jgi:saccharopine dehydrogenase (NAD+, L-lysine-forming)|nr:saccharopine dehydrogenase family protein [Bacteroidales bacterium]